MDTAAGIHGLKVALAWWIPGILLATAYLVFLYPKFADKTPLDDDSS